MVIWQHLCLAQVLSHSKNQQSSWCKSGPDFCGPGTALATALSQELRGTAAVYPHSEVASGLYIPESKERPQQRPVSFYRHSLKASARKKACTPNLPPTHSSLTTGRLGCSSFRRIQSFNSTRRLEAEYTRKGREEHHSHGMHRKQTKTGPLPLPPGGDEGRRAARREQNQESRDRPRTHPREGTPASPAAGGCRAAPAPRSAPAGCPLPTYPAPTARGSPRSDLRREESGYQLAPSAGGGRPPLSPSPPHPPGELPERGSAQAQAQAPAGGTRARPPPSRTWQQVGEAPHGALQLGGGGRVPPHVLLVALAQQAQPRRRARAAAGNGRGRCRRCRHGSHGRALPGAATAPARPAPPSLTQPSEQSGSGAAADCRAADWAAGRGFKGPGVAAAAAGQVWGYRLLGGPRGPGGSA